MRVYKVFYYSHSGAKFIGKRITNISIFIFLIGLIFVLIRVQINKFSVLND